jgi:hypothetical protein
MRQHNNFCAAFKKGLNPRHDTPDAGIVAYHPISKRNINIEPKQHGFTSDIYLVGKLEISCHGRWPLAKYSDDRFTPP